MKKLLSTLLALTMLLACASPAFAANDDGETRDTDFFTAQPHTDKDFKDLEYEPVDSAPIVAEAAALLEYAKTASPADFEKRFNAFTEEVSHAFAMYQLLKIRCDIDTTDAEATKELSRVYDEVYNKVFVAVNALTRDLLLLDNDCSEVLKSQMTEEDIQDALDYEEPSEEEQALDNKINDLELAYETVAHTNYTTTIDGVEYDADGVYNAFMVDGTITLEQYLQGCHDTYGAYGDLYLEMIEARNRKAQLNGYDNFAEYSYAEEYDRDYTVEEAAAFREAVKTYLAPQVEAYYPYYPSVDASAFPLDDSAYTGDGVFDTLTPYFAKMSDELLESMTTIKNQGYYDITAAEEKADRGYSWMLQYFNMPFYYNYPYENVQDLLTTIHEMGHNNQAYWAPNGWFDPSCNIDTAEVHSQGLELLMTKYYSDLFGDQAEEMTAHTTFSLLNVIIQGCLHDEIQCYAYSTPNVTFEMICQKYRQLAEEYSLVDSSDPRPEMYGWTSIHHTFNSAMYYISYATSAAGAFMFWEEAQDDFFGAVDHYLEFVALPGDTGFLNSFTEIGLPSPFSADYIQKLAKTAHDKLFFLNPYTDVYTDDWFVLPVYFVDYVGLMNGVSADKFSPNGATTREQAMTVLARYADEREDAEAPYTLDEGVAWAVENEISDGQNRTAALTREQVAVMLYRFAGSPEVEGDLSDFTDAASVSDWAKDAMVWAVTNGLVGGMGDGTINPQGGATRAQLAALLLRFYQNVD